MNLSRKDALTAGALLLASGGRAAAQTGLTPVRVASSPVADVAPLLYAQNAGLFRAAGLDVTLQKLTNGSAVAAALAGGATDIGKVASASIITAHAHGVPLTIVFPDRLHTFGALSETQLVVTPDSPVKSGRDLNGKTVSVGAIKDSTWLGVRLFVDTAGGDSSTVKFIELPFSAVAAAVVANRIDAGVDNDPFLKADVRAGKVRALGDLLGALGARFIETAWVASGDYLAQNRDTVLRFNRAIREAQAWCNGHTEQVADLASGFTGVDRATIATAHQIFATEVRPADMQPYVAACARYGIIPRGFDAAELFMR